MTRCRAAIVILVALCLLAPRAADATSIAIPTVPVGNVGNANDPATGYGAVGYGYRIGTTEVTNAQYAAFLNAKAASDPYSLYNPNMGPNGGVYLAYGGIQRSGVSGSYTYATMPDMADKPVNYVNWYDAIRFANWLHNGQGTGDTETGAYTLLGGTATPSNGGSITRNTGATWFLTSENEWYKAAYYQPAAQGGDTDDYWLYATASNNTPTIATANSVGDVSNPGANVANYNSGAEWNSIPNVTTVGSAGPASNSFYGTADQAGNVWEWNESNLGTARNLRGGSFLSDDSELQSSYRRNGSARGFESADIGFRVATVPEPSTAVLSVLGCAGLWLLRMRRRTRQ